MKTPFANAGSSSWSDVHVELGLVPGAPDGVVRGLEADAAELAAWSGPGSGPATALQARVRRAPLRAGQRQPAQAGVPDALRRDLGDEHEPAVGELGRAVGAVGPEDQLADEVAVDVGRPQLARRIGTSGR